MTQEPQTKAKKPRGRKPKRKKRPFLLSFILGFLKVIWIPAACVIALYIGLYIGYVKWGGQSASEIFQLHTWKHLYDLVFAD